MFRELTNLAADSSGQVLVEYALLIFLMAIVVFGAVQAFGLGVSGLYSEITAGMP